MKQELKDRLQKVLEEKSMPAKHLSLAAGLNETAVRDILIGRSRHPRTDTTRKIARALGVRHEWLVEGYGAREEHEAHNDTANRLSDNVTTQKGFSAAKTASASVTLYQDSADAGHEADIIMRPSGTIGALEGHIHAQLLCAVQMPNERMRPRCHAGEILYFRTDIPAATRDECLVHTHDGFGYIGVLNRLTDETAQITRYHGGEVMLSRRQVASLYPLVAIKKAD